MKISRFLAVKMILTIVCAGFAQSCSKSSTEKYPFVSVKPFKVQGILKYRFQKTNKDSIVAWPFGEAYMLAITDTNYILDSLPVLAEGSFELNLPADIPGNSFFSLAGFVERKGSQMQVQPDITRFMSDLQLKVFFTGVNGMDSINIRPEIIENNTLKCYYRYMVFDNSGTLQGQDYSNNTYAWTFNTDWNILRYCGDSLPDAPYNSETTLNLSDKTIWVNF